MIIIMLMHVDVDIHCTSIYMYKLYKTEVMRQSLYFLQVIKSKGGKESETEYFAALVNIHVFFLFSVYI